MTKLRTLSLLALAPLAFAADYNAGDAMGVMVGAEAQVSIVDISWGVTNAAANDEGYLLSTSRLTYMEAHDKLPNYAFGGGVTLRTKMAEDFGILARFTAEAGLSDGIGLSGTAAQAGTSGATNTFKSKLTLAPAAFVTFNESLGVGVIYDMREYEMEAVGTGLTTTSMKENQLLLALRGETKYDMDDLTLTLAFEASSNLGAKADSDAETYYNTLAGETDAGVDGTGVHTSITKITVAVGFEFANF